MSIISCIVAALAFGLLAFINMHRSAGAVKVRLSVGLLGSLLLACVQGLLAAAGLVVGRWLQFRSPTSATLYDSYNAYMLLGIVIVVVLKLLAPYLRREPQLAVFDTSRLQGMLAMAAATGIDCFLVGIGAGMTHAPAAFAWLTAAVVFPLSLLGVMYGRQKVTLRPRRWAVVAAVMLLAVAIATVVDA